MFLFETDLIMSMGKDTRFLVSDHSNPISSGAVCVHGSTFFESVELCDRSHTQRGSQLHILPLSSRRAPANDRGSQCRQRQQSGTITSRPVAGSVPEPETPSVQGRPVGGSSQPLINYFLVLRVHGSGLHDNQRLLSFYSRSLSASQASSFHFRQQVALLQNPLLHTPGLALQCSSNCYHLCYSH